MYRLSISHQSARQQQQQLELSEAVRPYEAIPSPAGKLPFIGHMHKLDMTKPWVAMDRWRREHGDMYRCIGRLVYFN